MEETRRLRGVIATLEETNATQAEALLEAETAAKLAGTAMGHQALYLEEAETAAKLAGNAITELEEEGIHQTQELREKLDAAERAADAALDTKTERMGAALEVVGAMRQWHEESTSTPPNPKPNPNPNLNWKNRLPRPLILTLTLTLTLTLIGGIDFHGAARGPIYARGGHRARAGGVLVLAAADPIHEQGLEDAGGARKDHDPL